MRTAKVEQDTKGNRSGTQGAPATRVRVEFRCAKLHACRVGQILRPFGGTDSDMFPNLRKLNPTNSDMFLNPNGTHFEREWNGERS